MPTDKHVNTSRVLGCSFNEQVRGRIRSRFLAPNRVLLWSRTEPRRHGSRTREIRPRDFLEVRSYGRQPDRTCEQFELTVAVTVPKREESEKLPMHHFQASVDHSRPIEWHVCEHLPVVEGGIRADRVRCPAGRQRHDQHNPESPVHQELHHRRSSFRPMLIAMSHGTAGARPAACIAELRLYVPPASMAAVACGARGVMVMLQTLGAEPSSCTA